MTSSVVRGISSSRCRFSSRLWLLPVAMCIVKLLVEGTERSSGLIFVALMEEEHYQRFVTSIQFSAKGVAEIFTAPLVGFLGTRMSFGALSASGTFFFVLGKALCYFSTNIYAVTLFNGFVSGGGCLIATILIPSLINAIFKDNKSTAMGVATLGPPLGGLLWPHLTQFFLDNYGLKGTFLLTAGICLNSYIAIMYISNYLKENRETKTNSKALDKHLQSMNSQSTEKQQDEIMFPNCQLSVECQHCKNVKSSVPTTGAYCGRFENKFTEDTNEEGDEEANPNFRKGILFRILTSRAFYLLTFTNIMVSIAQTGINQLLVDYMSDKGFERQSALLMITSFALGGILGRLCLGWISDTGLMSPRLQKALTLAIFASTQISITFLYQFYVLWVCYFVLGICQASVLVTNWVHYGAYFGSKEMIVAMAANRFFKGFFQICRAPLQGLLRDLLSTYDYFFVAISFVLYVISVFWVYEEFQLKWKVKYRMLNTEDPDEIKFSSKS